MTNPNNGATLEDCHSNFFALTDLCGIKWRRLVSDGCVGSGHPHHSFGPLDDPVLASFARCLASDILCVWRRSPTSKQSPSSALDPFQPQNSSQPFIHSSQGSNVPTGPTPPPPLHMTGHHLPTHPHMMPPHMGMGMGPGQINSIGPPFSAVAKSHHGMSSHPSSLHPPLYNNNNTNPTLNGPKELWIFWYGEEPDLSGLVNQQLLESEADQGSWESGLSYECRTLLFKALHNLIERCLLAREFVRIGKWFIQPCDDNQRIGVKNFPMQLTFSFSFFVHGESTVCMSVDVRQHPSVKRVTKNHITACQTPNQTLPVILAPHGLSGTLTGVGYRLNDPGTHKILEEWKHFYPVQSALKPTTYDLGNSQSGPQSSPNQQTQTNQQAPATIPPVLEVIVGGVRMRYPSCYVLCTELDDPPRALETNVQLPVSAAPKSRVPANSTDSEAAACPSGSPPSKPQGSHTLLQEVEHAAATLPERVWQESVLNCNSNVKSSSDATNTNTVSEVPTTNHVELGNWDFTDPNRKTACTCSSYGYVMVGKHRCKRISGSKNSGHNSGSQSTKGSVKFRKSTFHKRATQQMAQVENWANIWDLTEDASAATSGNTQTSNNSGTSSKGNDLQNLSNQPSSNNRLNATPGTPLGGPPSYKTGPGSISGVGAGNDGPGASPASIAPSPLATPRSQPASVPQQEPPMPTLSPQPPSDKVPAATPDNSAPKSVSSISNQVFSPLTGSFDGATIKTEPGVDPSSGANTSNDPQTNSSTTTLCNTTDINNFGSNHLQTQHNGGLVRPVLPSKEYENMLAEEDSSQPSDVIYDYTAMQAWLNHPVKRMKTNDGAIKATMYSWGMGMKKIPDVDPSTLNGSQEKHMSGKNSSDPYEFVEENSQAPAAAANTDNVKRKEGIKEEEKSPYCPNEPGNNGPKVPPGNLFTIEGLQPSFRDLDQIFDNSDTSSDENFQAPTPPGSNKPSSSSEETGLPSLTSNGTKNKCLGILRPEELSKMFPTPPSHEHNPIASPGGLQPETPLMDSITDNCIRRNHDSYPGLGSPPDEPIEDWSYVYKSPTVYKLMGSSKYAPLSALPSQQSSQLAVLPISTYKPSWQTPELPAPQTNEKKVSQQQPHQVPGNLQRPPAPTPTPLQQLSNVGSMGPTVPNNSIHLRPGLSPISPVPNSIRGPQFDLGSPPSNNMYLKQAVQHSHANHPHPGHHHMYGSRGLEAHALVVNLSLSDSVINLFRDHNFDSCTMCVCNAGIKVVGNIRGSEVGLYIPDMSPEEDQVRCNCGFSASANRRLAHRSGLFYEDEYEITTPALAPLAMPGDEWYEDKKKPSLLLLDPKYPNVNAINADKDAIQSSTILDAVPPYLLEMLREQCLLLYGSSAASRFTGEVIHHRWTERTYNYLEYLDGNRAALTALEHGRTVMLEASGRSGFPRMPEDSMPLPNKGNFMHKWSYLWARGPQSSQDVMQVMRALAPLIQDAVHAKAWDAQYTVSGPLTWRQFHRLAGRGTDDRCEPQPIPSILVGSEKDWIALSPLAIKYWEKLLLEPYAYPRDVAYIVVAPENDFILQKVRTYFRELSSMYEICQLGRHCPISKVLREGIMRVGRNAAVKLASEPVDEWFTMLPDIPASTTLKLYAQVCRYYLAPQLANISLDQSLLDCPNTSSGNKSSSERPTPSPKMPPPNSEHSSISGSSQGPTTPKNEFEQEYNSKEGTTQEPIEDDERDPPALVIYLVEPFGFGSDNKDLHRMANLGLLRCFTSMLNHIPDNIKNNITLQVISLEDILNLGNHTLDVRFKNDQMRATALTVYSQCRRLLTHVNNVKSLTGFGPAAASELFLKTKDEKKKGAYKLFTPPYVLAPTKEKVSEGVEWLGGIQGHTVGGMVSSGNSLSVGPSFCPNASSVLYVAYCISEDQRWLLASATDDRGELLETCTISIYVPNRSKRRKASARKHGLQKLMDFMLGIMSTSVHPWRLVVGRLGRVGHGELESWSTLLSRKSLLRASNQLKDSCRQCSLQYPADTPCVLSACLVSLEPDSCLRLMPDQFTPDERFGVNSGTSTTLSTPQDVSCTHILVFPTSATTQSSQTAFQEQHINGPDLGDEDLLFINVNEDMSDGIDGMQDLQLGDIFSWADTGPGAPSPVGSPRRDSTSQPGSPGGVGASGRQSPFQSGGQGRTGGRSDASDELGTLLQQPLALGYMVSTAPSGQLPHWFWSSCPQRSTEKSSGVFLKSALHLHSHSVLHNLDDLLQQQSNAKQHPLDSQFTTDVLRFVLEGYNALSWLCLDPTTHDRTSCLPVHIQKLLQLYYTISALV